MSTNDITGDKLISKVSTQKYGVGFELIWGKKGHCMCPACKDGVLHASDCAVHNEPAMSNGPCDCGVTKCSE